MSAATRRHIGRALACCAAFILAAATGLATLAELNVPVANAADASGFNAGYIISDANFYNSDAMTASDVQNFLNSKVPQCHPEWDSDPSDIVCLKDYHQQTTTKSADSYCKGYTSQWQSAAQMIDGVARSCGISQKVLLVMLQKEQGLVTHSWPSSYRYTTAMGYACPDTAPCDAQYYGFFNQVYDAARQFKLYQASPSAYRYRAGQNNYIQWSPTTSCGGSTVYIQNLATAGLYNYTPYQPNAAALAAGYGNGDACSSYGNRNFYLYYSDWFGRPTDPPVYGDINAAWQRAGAGSGVLGRPTDVEHCTWAGQASHCYQDFANGTIDWSPTTGAHFTTGPIRAAWSRVGWGTLGLPTGDQWCDANGTRCFQIFVNGAVDWTPATGAHPTWGAIRSSWIGEGANTSADGLPISDPTWWPQNGGGYVQQFQHGSIHWTPTTGAVFVPNGPIQTEYVRQGFQAGQLGWPTSQQTCTMPGGGCRQNFQRGILISTGTTAARLDGDIQALWEQLGGASGTPGYPLGNTTWWPQNGGGYVQQFQHGSIHWTPTTGAVFVPNGPIQTEYVRQGFQAGQLGWPTSQQTCDAHGVCSQRFAGGILVASPGTGVTIRPL